MSSSEAMAGDPGVDLPFQDWFVTAFYGWGSSGLPATPGAPVRFVRVPDDADDPNTIAVHDAAGRRLGYLSVELAADYAGLIDAGVVQLSGRLLAVGEPGFDAWRALTHPPLIVYVHADQDRLDEFLEQDAPV